jgi:hypothetical protein
VRTGMNVRGELMRPVCEENRPIKGPQNTIESFTPDFALRRPLPGIASSVAAECLFRDRIADGPDGAR